MVEMLLMYLKAFVVGGAICTVAQLLINYTKLTSGKILVYFLLAGLFLQAIGVYQYIVDFAGAGATTPLTGFGFLISEGVREAVDEKGLLGALTGAFTAASGGISAALIFGYLAALISRGKPKN